MQGTGDSLVLQQDHAYILFEVLICSDATKKDGDTECKPKELMKIADGSSDELLTEE